MFVFSHLKKDFYYKFVVFVLYIFNVITSTFASSFYQENKFNAEIVEKAYIKSSRIHLTPFEIEKDSREDDISIKITKAKNSVLPLLIASLMHNGLTNIHIGDSVDLTDVKSVINILKYLGANIYYDDQKVCIDATNIKSLPVEQILCSPTRYSILILGCLASRFGSAEVGQPGGCNLKRPINFHIDVLKELGYQIIEENNSIRAIKKFPSKLFISLPYPSVGATLNAVFAVSASNLDSKNAVIEISNCAIEPEVDDVINYLKKIGLDIHREDKKIKVSTLRNYISATVDHVPINDRVEAGSYMLAAAILRKSIQLIDAPSEYMESTLLLLKSIGCLITTKNNLTTIRCDKINSDSTLKVFAEPYPGFPTDLQPILAVLCTTLNTSSTIIDTVMPDRTDFILELNKMGANIKSYQKEILISPKEDKKLIETVSVNSTDLRATMAIVLYALGHKVSCKIDHFNYIYRGYAKVDEKINLLGGKIFEVIEDT